MSLTTGNLLDLNVEKIFEERSIDYIIEIERLIDEEIERKRGELRLMVGDRYKDVLAASDAIKSMKSTSEDIVCNIEKITQTCEEIVTKPSIEVSKYHHVIPKDKINERTLLIQLRLTIFLNEQIWIMLNSENTLDSAQYYLFAQHIHTGLSLLKPEELKRIPILNQIRNNLKLLRSTIFEKITQKLESVETTLEEINRNLNSLMLLENQTGVDLLNVFIEHRKIALQTVIDMEYSSVRAQISSMVKCLLTTITLLHECFLENKDGDRGLIWKHVKELSHEMSYTTLSKLNLPITPLTSYIPDILKTFRPRYKIIPSETYINNIESVMKNWLESTHITLSQNLKKLLQLVPNVRGLHLAKEESHKIDLPKNWEQICTESYFPTNFEIWSYFFQQLFTERCKSLISQKINLINEEINSYLKEILENVSSTNNPEMNLRSSIWMEDPKDILKAENKLHKSLLMKTKGFSEVVVDLCFKLDKKYVELLEDVSQYLYGKEYNSDVDLSLAWKDFKFKRKFTDTVEIENYLKAEATKTALLLPIHVENLTGPDVDDYVVKSIVCARFLQSTLQLCPSFRKCCSFNNSTDDWLKICDSFTKCTYRLWRKWLEDIIKGSEKKCTDLLDLSPRRRIQMILRWDEIEIQEQTEEKIFKSQIKLPLKPSLALYEVLQHLNHSISQILPFTLPKPIHLQFIEENIVVILGYYKQLLNENINQKQAIQFLFDIRYLSTFCVPRENVQLINCSQEICDSLRSRIDPFDLDVFYCHIQSNVKKAVSQSQIFLGCLLPSSTQLSNLGLPVEKSKDLNKMPSVLAVSNPSTTSWFPLLPITLPIHKPSSLAASKKNVKDNSNRSKAIPKKSQDPTRFVKQSASSFFGGLNTDWFS